MRREPCATDGVEFARASLSAKSLLHHTGQTRVSVSYALDLLWGGSGERLSSRQAPVQRKAGSVSSGPDKATLDEGDSEYRKIFDAAVDGLIISDIASGRILQANPAACQMHGYTRRQILGLEISALIHPESRQQFNENLRAFELGADFDSWTRLLRQDGSTSYSRWRGGRMDFGGHACMLWSIRDVSERIQAEQRLRQRMKSRTREQTALLQISQTLSSTLDFAPGLILDQLRELIPFDRGVFFSLNDQALVALAARGFPEPEPSAPVRFPVYEQHAMAALLNAGKPTRIGDISGNSRQAVFWRSMLGRDGAVFLNGMLSWMWVPLAVRDGILGGLGVAHAKRSFYTPHHANLALSVTNQAVMTMVNAELYKNAQAAAAAQERQRLAQSLHDAVNQSLFSAGLIAEVLPRVWEQNPELAWQSLDDMRRLMRGAAAEMRALLAELRPSSITEAELGALLQLLGDAFTGRTTIPVTIMVSGEGSLPPDVQMAVYRICQEAMNNISRHADATRVDVTLNYADNAMELGICDDGGGFDPQNTDPGHYGLIMMRERAAAVGAGLWITSQPGHGVEIRIRWPKSAAEEK
jgi:PAS domain S-box-containing protein